MQATSHNECRRKGRRKRRARPAAPRRRCCPPVDIVEDGTGITRIADLPGVGRDGLSIGVDGRTLTIEAPLRLGEANSWVSVYAEVHADHSPPPRALSGVATSTPARSTRGCATAC